MITDTTFFTNEPGYALLDRSKKTLKRKTVKYRLPTDEEQGYFFAKSSLKSGRPINLIKD